MATETVKYVIYTTVQSIEEKKERAYVSGHGDGATFKAISLGWFAVLDGSREAIHLGDEKPELEVGDKMKITIEKV